MSLTLEQVRTHPSISKLRNITYSLLSLLMRRIEVKHPDSKLEVYKLLEISGFYLTYAIMLYLVRKHIDNTSFITMDDIAIFFEKTEQRMPVLYHDCDLVPLEREVEAHLNGEEIDQNADSYILYTRNLPAGFYLLFGATRKCDVQANKVSVEIYKFAPLREGDWMYDISVRLKLDMDMIFQPLGVLYLDKPQPEQIMSYLRITNNATIDVSLISLTLEG